MSIWDVLTWIEETVLRFGRSTVAEPGRALDRLDSGPLGQTQVSDEWARYAAQVCGMGWDRATQRMQVMPHPNWSMSREEVAAMPDSEWERWKAEVMPKDPPSPWS